MKIKQIFFIVFLSIAVMLSSGFAQDNTKVGLPDGAIARLGKGGINLMRFSPDGTRLVVGTDVGVWVYNVTDGKETALFTGHKGQINALAFSPDGKILVSSGFNNPIIQSWDLETGRKLSTLTLNDTRPPVVLALAFYGKTLISLDRGEITYWNVDTGRKLADVDKNMQSYAVVTTSKDGSTFAVGDRAGEIHLWDVTTDNQSVSFNAYSPDPGEKPEVIRVPAPPPRPPKDDIQALAFSPDGKILASTIERSKTVQLWDTENQTKLATLEGHTGWVITLTFSEDGKTLASGDAGKVIKLWDVSTQRERATLEGHKNTINTLAFAPDGPPPYGGCLASGSADGTIRFWNPGTGKEITTFTAGHTEWVKAVAFSKNGAILASAVFNGTVDIWSLKTRQELTTFTAGQCDAAIAVALSSDATRFASQGSDGLIVFNSDGFGSSSSTRNFDTIRVWEIGTGEEILGPWQNGANTSNMSTGMEPLTFSPDNKILAVREHQGIRAWDVNIGVELLWFNTEGPFPMKLVFSSNGTLLATSGFFGTPQAWDITTQTETVLPNIKDISVLAFSPDNTTAAIVSDREVYLWKLNTIEEDEPNVLPGHLHPFTNILAFSSDGTFLVGSGEEAWDFPIKIWNVETGNQLVSLTGHTEHITTLIFSHDGKTLASGSEDGTVLLWDWDEITVKGASDNKGDTEQ